VPEQIRELKKSDLITPHVLSRVAYQTTLFSVPFGGNCRDRVGKPRARDMCAPLAIALSLSLARSRALSFAISLSHTLSLSLSLSFFLSLSLSPSLALPLCVANANPAVSTRAHRTYLPISFRTSISPQNYQLIVYYCLSKYQVDGFVGELTF
jgi:hypothetical protein